MPSDSSSKIPSLDLQTPSAKRRRQALDEFAALLSSEVKEQAWQSFFDANPFALIETLPVRLQGLFRQVPLVSGVPDYVFYNQTVPGLLGDYGVIEIKRPDQSILGTYSAKIVVPSRHLRAAQQEVVQHLRALQGGWFLRDRDFFAVGNRRHAFVILGRTEELIRKSREEVVQAQLRHLLPDGLQLFTYDELFARLQSSVGPIVHVLTAGGVGRDAEASAVFVVNWKLGMHARPCAHMVRMALRFRSDVWIGRGDTEVNGKSIMGMMVLAAEYGVEVHVRAIGPDAERAVAALTSLANMEFGMRLLPGSHYEVEERELLDTIVADLSSPDH